MATDRGQWATRIGFILAAVGSAVGLGNIWRFPFQVAQNGGAAFLVMYLLFVFLIGFPALLVEFIVGRRTDKNPVGALKEIATGPFRYLGYLFVFSGFVILSYYSVVGGWTLRYAIIGVVDGYANAISSAGGAGVLFGSVSTGHFILVLHAIFMAIVIGIVALGVQRGIEIATKIMVPSIVGIALILVGYAATLSGAGEAYSYYLSPNLDVIFANWTSLIPAAAGQAFFTLSLGMGVMITYSSYLGTDWNLAKDGISIVALNTAIGVIFGLVVFPILFTAGVSPNTSGAGAVFVALADAFGGIVAGRLIGIVFFLVVAIAAVSSAISILEVVVSYAVDELDADRPTAAAGAGGAIFLLGVPVAYDTMFLNIFDGLVSGVLLVLGGLLLVIFVSWIASDLALAEIGQGVKEMGSYGVAWLWMVRVPILIVLVVSLVLGIIDYIEFLQGDFASWLNNQL